MATTTAVVTIGCSSHSQRHRVRDATTSPSAMTDAHPMCRDGMAAYWLAIVSLCGDPYTAGPNRAAVSMSPVVGSIRGGASGTSRCRASAAAVSATSTRRTHL
ncbi:hypothetical protein GCM10022254_10310 [Actinomadura meridiana]|uniref:Uncharacterized protein n=1 Tax=Actinomadura meridiana TaxID=559626 RepID=A0ABP8BTX3_9ACTN